MPGYQSIFYGTPPAPPNRCAVCQLSNHEDITYFVDTGIWAEHEGVIYLCNRCFEPLVDLTELYLRKSEHKTVVEEVRGEVELVRTHAVELQGQAELLHELFGLRLADLDKFKSLSEKLTQLQTAASSSEQLLSQRKAEQAISDTEVVNRQALLEMLDRQIVERQNELNVYIEASLTTKLEHIGRADLVPILLNNVIEPAIDRASNEDEREIDGNSRDESESSGISFAL